LKFSVGNHFPRGPKCVLPWARSRNRGQIEWKRHFLTRRRLNHNSFVPIRPNNSAVVLLLAEKAMHMVLASDADDYSATHQVLCGGATTHRLPGEPNPMQKHSNPVTQ
jgi:hypothetical protein